MTVTLTHEVQEVAKELKLLVDKVSVVLELLAEGNTHPFHWCAIKKTGALDEVQIHEIETFAIVMSRNWPSVRKKRYLI